MKIGEYELSSVMTGLFRLDGGAMFGVVPKNLWERTNPSDEQNRIDMCTRALLLQSKDKKILIDTGVGYKLSEKVNKIYAVDFTHHKIEDSLAALKVNKEEITDVILTHLHFDHAGGSTFYDNDHELQLTFPNAAYHVQKKQYEWALNPTERDRASFFPENYVPLSNAKVLNFTDGEFKFDHNITLLPVNGHTSHMQMIKISDGVNTLLYTADLIPTAGHVPAPYVMGYDLFPLTTLEEKHKYLKEAEKNDWIIFFEHDPHNECARIGFNEKGYFIKERFKLVS